ncbi:MAG: ABC transporter permease subunit [Planctomycetes bacterium]|nr:ABC transporter permease subunit [Planctomycetota bacterium]
MIWFIVRRLIGLVLTLWVVFTVSFLLMRAVPGGPYSGERNLPPEIEENVKHRYRLDRPIYEQYGFELGNILSGDFGQSMRLYDFDVNQVIAQGLPISAALGIFALSFAVTLGLSAGIVSALYRGSLADWALMSLATIGIALPSFVIAGLSIMLFVFLIPVFPAAGWGTFRQLVLPAVCLGSLYAAEIARIARTGMLDAMSQDYVRTARAKGLSKLAVALRHALPGAMMPVVSFLGPAVAGILTGSVVIERIFAIPGLGWHFVQAALQRDYTLAMGLVLLYTLLLYTMNFLVDLSYGILDPRVELK